MKYATKLTSLTIEDQEIEIKDGIIEGHYFSEGFCSFYGLTPIVGEKQEEVKEKQEEKKEAEPKSKATRAKKD